MKGLWARFQAPLWADQPLANKGLVVVALPLVVLLLALVAVHISSRAEERAEADVRLAVAIQRDIHEVHALLAEAASGVRGYLLSGEVRFLEPYREAEAKMPATLSRLDGQIRDPDVRRRFEKIRELTVRKRQGLAGLLVVVDGARSDPARLQAELTANKVVLDSLREEIGAIQAREATLLNERLQRADRVRERSLLLIALCGLIGVLGSLVAVYLFSTGIVRRVKSLEMNAGRLERGELLAPPLPEHDELGSLARKMDEAGRLLRARESALKESEERFRLVVEGVRDYGIFALDPTGKVVSWNNGAERIKGWTADEILGQGFSAFYPPETRAVLPQVMLERATQDGRTEDEGWRLRKDGSRFWANVVITALRDDAGHLRGFSKVTRDITDRKRAEEELLAAQAAAVAANEAKSAFLSRTSHELQTPLGAVLGFAQLLDMDRAQLSESQRTAVDQIRSAGQHLEALIDDVLDISAIEAGRIDLMPGPIDIGEVVEEAVRLARSEAGTIEAGVSFTPLAGPVEAAIFADRRRVLQVMINLVSNAIKYNRPGGRVDISVERDGQAVRLWVEDTGEGLSLDHYQRVFSPFDRLGQECLGRARGTGLGLALSRQLVEAMGGAIGYGPRRDAARGTAFWVRLPGVSDDLDRG